MKPVLSFTASLPSVVLSVVLLSACSGPDSGLPAHAAPQTTAATTSVGTAVSPPRSRHSSLDQVDPCGLVTDEYVIGLAYTVKEPWTDGEDRRQCTYTTPAGAPKLIIAFPLASLQDLRAFSAADRLRSTRVGEHDARVKVFGDGTKCTVSMAVSPTRRVDVHTADFATTQAACTQAATVARDVEAVLPLPS